LGERSTARRKRRQMGLVGGQQLLQY